MKRILILLFAGLVLSASAQNSLPIKKITLFKNATGMIVKEGILPVKDGGVAMPIPEQVLFGTFFMGSQKDNSIKNVVFRDDTLKKQDRSRAVWQFLAGNINKPVVINYTPTQGIDKSVSGKVVSYDLYNGLLKFLTDAGKTLVMHVGSIYQADFKDDPSAYYMADSIKRMMVLKPEKPANDIQLQQIYMTGGINWIPSYFLRLKDDKTARLEMKATIENYAEDLNETDMELVVGAPQMIYSNKPDPMTYNYLSFATSYNGNDGKPMQGYMQSNAVTTYAATGGTTEFFADDFTVQGEKTDDMYIYQLGKVTLPKQSKGTYPIFAGNVEYKDKYEGTIPDKTNYYSTRYCSPEEKTYDVFHSLEIKNTSTVPLTTASIMVLNEKEQFVAQDELKYTPVGASTDIKLSKAIDIVTKNTEEEKGREDNAKKIGKQTYSKVVLKGTIEVNNYQNKEVTVSITKLMSGTVDNESDGGTVVKQISRNYINPASQIKWDVKVKPNDKKILTYEYEVYFIP
jgi:hypothetical protein